MAASDIVASYPGGITLKQLADSVNANLGAIQDIANAWQKASGNCSDDAAGVGNAAKTALRQWQGSGAEAFTTAVNRFGKACANTEQTLNDAGMALFTAAGDLGSAHKNIEGICQSLIDQVAQIPTAKRTDAAVSPLVQSAISQAEPMISKAESELGPIVTELQGYVSAMKGSNSFSALPLPSGGAFDPSVPAAGPGMPTAPGTKGSGTTGIALAGGGAGSGTPGGTGTASGGSGGVGGLSDPSGFGQVPVPSGTPAPRGQVNDWISEAMKILEQNGVPASELNANDIWIIIEHESGGNPNAVNNWDSNAAAGTPSTGLMQTIAPTFNAYALPGHGSITNPVDNIIAGVRYAISRYGSLSNVPGVKAVDAGLPYVGY